MAYEKCLDVSEEIWKEFQAGEPAEITGRLGILYEAGRYRLPFLNRTLFLDPVRRQVQVAEAPEAEPGFRLCLTALLYLLRVNPALLGPALSPLELAGGATFFGATTACPTVPWKNASAGTSPDLWPPGPNWAACPCRRAMPRWRCPSSPVVVEVILWQADEEFPAQVSFTLPAHLDRFWSLDAVWGLLHLVAQEWLNVAPGESS